MLANPTLISIPIRIEFLTNDLVLMKLLQFIHKAFMAAVHCTAV